MIARNASRPSAPPSRARWGSCRGLQPAASDCPRFRYRADWTRRRRIGRRRRCPVADDETGAARRDRAARRCRRRRDRAAGHGRCRRRWPAEARERSASRIAPVPVPRSRIVSALARRRPPVDRAKRGVDHVSVSGRGTSVSADSAKRSPQNSLRPTIRATGSPAAARSASAAAALRTSRTRHRRRRSGTSPGSHAERMRDEQPRIERRRSPSRPVAANASLEPRARSRRRSAPTVGASATAVMHAAPRRRAGSPDAR